MDTAHIEKWVNHWQQHEKDAYHILTKPSPVLLTTAYAQDVVSGYQIANEWVKRA